MDRMEMILAAYDELATRPGGVVRLTDLRGHLGDIDQDELTDALVEMDRERQIQLEPDPDRAGLTVEDREAAINLGGQQMHLMLVNTY